MSVRAFAIIVAGLLLASAASAYTPPTRVQNILHTAPSRDLLRQQLRAYADSVGREAPIEAGEAWRFLADSYARAGETDSALAIAERAIELRGDVEERVLTADLLLERSREGDLARVSELLAGARMQVADGPAARRAPISMRMAWALQRMGRAREAADLAAEDLAWIAASPAWALRLAPSLETLPARRRPWRTLLDAAVHARGRDSSLVRIAERAAAAAAPESAALLRDRVAAMHRAEQAFAEARGGRLAGWTAGSAVWHLPPVGAARGRVLLVLPSSVPSIVEADSLLRMLHGLQLEVLAVSGVAVPPEVGASGIGRERAERALAAELRTLLGPASGRARPVVVMSGEELAWPAVQAACEPAAAAALVLLTPWPSVIDRGPLAHLLEASGVPLFIQTAPEAILGNEYADRLAAQLPMRQVRVADGLARGLGVVMLRQDPAALRRLRAWMDEALKSPHATPPRRRR